MSHRQVAIKFHNTDSTAWDGKGWYVKILETNCVLGPFEHLEAEEMLEEVWSDLLPLTS